ncbi:sulfurtransferase TusA family protein [Natrinema caseinilyticum]|uniref:sulfurtransferase TusA family protein n=1 Tax=Natrinema caseinilyticum TaxID=2961570 RepID=UPI0020C3E594|nr:sulfurtransferase TusA family protein [Natrinema caseinilyticum]
MQTDYETADTLDVRGESCPMPVVKTKSAVDGLEPNAVLEVLATDPGSVSDIRGWADATADVELLDQHEADRDGETVYEHYVRRVE